MGENKYKYNIVYTKTFSCPLTILCKEGDDIDLIHHSCGISKDAWKIFMIFCRLLFFSINILLEYCNTIRVSNSFGPDKDRRFIGSDLGPKCLQRFSADDTIR